MGIFTNYFMLTFLDQLSYYPINHIKDIKQLIDNDNNHSPNPIQYPFGCVQYLCGQFLLAAPQRRGQFFQTLQFIMLLCWGMVPGEIK